MIALDTNVLLRYILDDDVIQTEIARKLLEDELTSAEPGFISLIVVVELVWVMRRLYRQSAERVAAILLELTENAVLVIEHAAFVRAAIVERRADISDILLHEVGRLNGCSRTVTFDRGFSTLPHVDLLC